MIKKSGTRRRVQTKGVQTRAVAFQGAPGAYSDLACRDVFPRCPGLPCRSFEDALDAVHAGKAAKAMIPVENTIAGRVAEIHQILPRTRLSIIAEHYQPVTHCLLALPGAKARDITRVHSHIHALSQCRNAIKAAGYDVTISTDTAGAARDVAAGGDPTQGAIASHLAAQIYGLDIVKTGLEDTRGNVTRFLILARRPVAPPKSAKRVMTSFIFFVRNVPAAVYKALGGFATNGVNMTRLESFMGGANFNQAQFFADIEGRPTDPGVRLAFEELRFFSREVTILGVYPAHPFRHQSQSKPPSKKANQP